MAVLDTTFLIDLMREIRRNQKGRAHDKFAELERRGEPFVITAFTVAELLVGVQKATDPAAEKARVEACVAIFDCLSFGEVSAVIYGELVGQLELRGEAIADMDALIASVTLEHGELLVTRNPKHFRRISGLIVEDY